MKKYFSILALMLVLFMAVGCTEKQPIYGEDDKDITVNAGDTFVIQLEENPTTGYRWSVSISDEDIVKLDKDDYQQRPTDTGVVGAGGTRILTFKGLKQGTAVISLTYERSFEESSAVETLEYKITVK